jgi:PAS domain S-box-containing protein
MPSAKIMIIEDEAIIAKDIENILLNCGYEIAGNFASAEDAITSVNSMKPDLILMDVVLKGNIDGIEASSILKQKINVPIIFITAFADDITLSRIKNSSPHGYFLKPFEEKELRTWIETTLEKFSSEKDLIRNEKLAVSIINNLEEGLISSDEAGYIYFLNTKAGEITGYKLEDAKGLKLTDVLNSREIKASFESINKIIPHGGFFSGKTELLNRKNKKINIDYRLTPLETFSSGKASTILIRESGEDRDAKLRELAAKLNESNKELEKFAYVASHDLQEPLRMVTSYVQLLQKRYKGKLDADADEFINYAVDGVSRMRNLIEDLLIYSRISSRKLKKESVDTGEVVSEIISQINKEYNLTNHSIKFSGLPVVNADKYQMRQLFYHLLSNSVKFNNQPTPLVEIKCSERGNEFVYSVSDNGIGIEKQYLERIFEAFQKLHNHKEYPGSGIGLTVCKKIVELHGGKVSVESEPLKGTIIRFTLPKG